MDVQRLQRSLAETRFAAGCLRIAAGCLLIAAAACGRLDFATSPGGDAAGGSGSGSDAGAARSMTMVGGLSQLPAGALDLGATGTPTGFTISFTTASGSDMYGVNLDSAMHPDADWRSTSASNKYIATTMTWTGSPMTTMTTDAGLTYIKRYVADLSSYSETDMQNGLGATPAYASAGGRWFYAVIDTAALHLHEMASDGTPVGNAIDVAGGGPAGTPLGGALAGDGATLYAIWSHTPGSCAWATASVAAPIAPAGAAVAATCLAPRLAAASGEAAMVFDDGASLQAMTTTPAGSAAAPAMLGAGTAARIAPAAAGGFWLAWQAGGELRVAAYAPGQPLLGEPAGAPAGLQAYELVAAGSHTYLFAIAGRQLWWSQIDR